MIKIIKMLSLIFPSFLLLQCKNNNFTDIIPEGPSYSGNIHETSPNSEDLNLLSHFEEGFSNIKNEHSDKDDEHYRNRKKSKEFLSNSILKSFHSVLHKFTASIRNKPNKNYKHKNIEKNCIELEDGSIKITKTHKIDLLNKQVRHPKKEAILHKKRGPKEFTHTWQKETDDQRVQLKCQNEEERFLPLKINEMAGVTHTVTRNKMTSNNEDQNLDSQTQDKMTKSMTRWISIEEADDSFRITKDFSGYINSKNHFKNKILRKNKSSKKPIKKSLKIFIAEEKPLSIIIKKSKEEPHQTLSATFNGTILSKGATGAYIETNISDLTWSKKDDCKLLGGDISGSLFKKDGTEILNFEMTLDEDSKRIIKLKKSSSDDYTEENTFSHPHRGCRGSSQEND